MVDFTKLITLLVEKGVKNIIATDEIYLSESVIGSVKVEIIKDLRSATFNALGRTKMTGKPSLVIFNEDYISSTYTALTEIWFQRENVILLSYNANLYERPLYLDRCLMASCNLLRDTDIEATLNNALKKKGPVLLRLQDNLCPDHIVDYDCVLGLLKQLNNDGDVVLYNPKSSNDILPQYTIIRPEHKYCVFSKYVGGLLAKRNKSNIICCPEGLLSYDTNIFNFRDLPSTVKIVLLKDNTGMLETIERWIKDNNILLFKGSKDIIKDLLKSNQPAVAYISE